MGSMSGFRELEKMSVLRMTYVLLSEPPAPMSRASRRVARTSLAHRQLSPQLSSPAPTLQPCEEHPLNAHATRCV